MNTIIIILLTIISISNIIAIVINIGYFYNFNKEDEKSNKKILNETDVLNLANSNRRKSIGIIRRWIRDKSSINDE